MAIGEEQRANPGLNYAIPSEFGSGEVGRGLKPIERGRAVPAPIQCPVSKGGVRFIPYPDPTLSWHHNW